MSSSITEKVVAVRERWHTKRHPFFRACSEGKLPLRALGRYQALHYQYVSYAVRSFGLFYTRFYQLDDVRKLMAENLAEEEGRFFGAMAVPLRDRLYVGYSAQGPRHRSEP
jgi:pyrroloquinoline quinone (PQQ) biosynthesis protein C